MVFDSGQQSGWVFLATIGILTALFLFLWALNKVVMHFFPSTRNAHTGVGNALMRVEAVFLPGRDHVVEAIEHEESEQDDEGDPPTTTGRK